MNSDVRAHGDEHENYQKCFSARNESLPFEVQGKGDQIICCNTKNEDIWEKLGGLSTFRKNLFQTNLEEKKTTKYHCCSRRDSHWVPSIDKSNV